MILHSLGLGKIQLLHLHRSNETDLPHCSELSHFETLSKAKLFPALFCSHVNKHFFKFYFWKPANKNVKECFSSKSNALGNYCWRWQISCALSSSQNMNRIAYELEICMDAIGSWNSQTARLQDLNSIKIHRLSHGEARVWICIQQMFAGAGLKFNHAQSSNMNVIAPIYKLVSITHGFCIWWHSPQEINLMWTEGKWPR
jgi:hypothetical protein